MTKITQINPATGIEQKGVYFSKISDGLHVEIVPNKIVRIVKSRKIQNRITVETKVEIPFQSLRRFCESCTYQIPDCFQIDGDLYLFLRGTDVVFTDIIVGGEPHRISMDDFSKICELLTGCGI